MKKNFKFYAIIWGIMLAAFNVICFVTPNELGGLTKIDATFWMSYAFITAAFVGNLVMAFFAFRADNLKKMFYNVSVIKIGWATLISMLVIGSVIMAIPNCPSWIAAIVCCLIVVFNAIAVVKAYWAVSAVNKIDEKVKVQTAFIKLLTVDAENLLARAKGDEIKAECRKVYEAVRYSDPMSSDALVSVEERITLQFRAFEEAVRADDAELAKTTAEELLALIGDRNRKCKVLK